MKIAQDKPDLSAFAMFWLLLIAACYFGGHVLEAARAGRLPGQHHEASR